MENAVASGIQGVLVPDEKRLARTLLVEVWEALTRYLTMGVSTRRLDQFEIFVVFVAGQSRVQTALLVVSVDFWYIVYAKDDI